VLHRITIFIFTFCLLSNFIFGQAKLANPEPVKVVRTNLGNSMSTSARTVEIDTLMPTIFGIDSCTNQTANFTHGGGWGYVGGTNSFGDLAKAQLIHYDHPNFMVKEALIYMGIADTVGNRQVTAKIYESTGEGQGPGTLLATSDPINVVDLVLDSLLLIDSTFSFDTTLVADSSLVVNPILFDTIWTIDSSFVIDTMLMADSSLVIDTMLVVDSSLMANPILFDTTLVADASLVVDTMLVIDSSLVIDTVLMADSSLVIDTMLVIDSSLVIDAILVADSSLVVDSFPVVDTTLIVDSKGLPTTFVFSRPPQITTNSFFVSLDISSLYSGRDTLSILMTSFQCGVVNEAWELLSDGSTWVPLSDENAGSWGINSTFYMAAIVAPDNTSATKELVAGSQIIRLYDAFPNPTSEQLTIRYDIKERTAIQIEIYSLTGQLLHQIDKNILPTGQYQEHISINNLAAGTYFYGIRTDNGRLMNKFSVVK